MLCRLDRAIGLADAVQLGGNAGVGFGTAGPAVPPGVQNRVGEGLAKESYRRTVGDSCLRGFEPAYTRGSLLSAARRGPEVGNLEPRVVGRQFPGEWDGGGNGGKDHGVGGGDAK
eukprot:9381326-Lingulodinium_polyedra.AAC.1